MPIKYESLETVLQKSQMAIVVELLSISPLQEAGYWQSVEFRALSTRTLFGDQQPDRTLACRYSQGRPHRRGDIDVFPRVTGSGLEFRMKQGDRVIVLLGAPEAESEIVKVLRIEPLSSARTIQKYQGLPPDSPTARESV